MDEGVLDPDGARERMAAWKGRIDKLAADTQAMSDRMRAIRVTAQDPGGIAEVTVDSTGALVDLRLSDRINRATPDAVARAIMATLAAARGQVADRSQEIIAETVGTESAAARAISDNVDRHLRRPARPAPDDDEGYDGRSYLRG
ncbi:YbaB/EbfC DNA-binding family protein [Saccharothrix carnea]|uniref:YbaB/EbfC DNA-binding family protein n=1 Tax=Saccharothrix carnea TaxID=1280637 RepID=A0A2P8IBI0_SACCR|nr:YbaB/EbfC family nucleoid-associated protein [Saccharothrix carnea]PSL55829.1 YbaB/EbfC DNA-binding family protein [Saccharothrix carnea]